MAEKFIAVVSAVIDTIADKISGNAKLVARTAMLTTVIFW